jgi:energy-converting hydrogenase Eha subunit B
LARSPWLLTDVRLGAAGKRGSATQPRELRCEAQDRMIAIALIVLGFALCALGCYFVALGVFDRSADNALVDYFVMATVPLFVGVLLVVAGLRGVRHSRHRPRQRPAR